MMALTTSTPDGFDRVGWKGYVIACVIVWLAPALIGAAALAVQWGLGSQTWGDGALMVWAGSVMLVISPMLSWFGLVMAAVPVSWLMDRGQFGWLQALATGVAVGAIAAWMMETALAITFGAALICALRWLLARRHPGAFQT